MSGFGKTSKVWQKQAKLTTSTSQFNIVKIHKRPKTFSTKSNIIHVQERITYRTEENNIAENRDEKIKRGKNNTSQKKER